MLGSGTLNPKEVKEEQSLKSGMVCNQEGARRWTTACFGSSSVTDILNPKEESRERRLHTSGVTQMSRWRRRGENGQSE